MWASPTAGRLPRKFARFATAPPRVARRLLAVAQRLPGVWGRRLASGRRTVSALLADSGPLPACSVRLPACSVRLPACSAPLPADSVRLPADSMRGPLTSRPWAASHYPMEAAALSGENPGTQSCPQAGWTGPQGPCASAGLTAIPARRPGAGPGPRRRACRAAGSLQRGAKVSARGPRRTRKETPQ